MAWTVAAGQEYKITNNFKCCDEQNDPFISETFVLNLLHPAEHLIFGGYWHNFLVFLGFTGKRSFGWIFRSFYILANICLKLFMSSWKSNNSRWLGRKFNFINYCKAKLFLNCCIRPKMKDLIQYLVLYRAERSSGRNFLGTFCIP